METARHRDGFTQLPPLGKFYFAASSNLSMRELIRIPIQYLLKYITYHHLFE